MDREKKGRYFLAFLRWVLLGLAVGGLGGLLGTGFHYALHFVTDIRLENPWLVWLLPAGGLASVGLYRILKLRDNRGTNEVIEASLSGRPVSPLVAPGIIGASCLTHLFGGSAGREGAALQLGGSMASGLGQLLKMKQADRKILVTCGMAAVFAALFGTPLTAWLFTLEFASVGTIFSLALLPCFLASWSAALISKAFGVHAEGLLLDNALRLTLGTTARVALLAALVSLLGILMCYIFHKAEHFAKKFIPNDWIRISLGGLAIALLTLAVGDMRYNGAGMDMALSAVKGNTAWFDFAVKLLFTAITLSAGFRGGEIVPTFCIGATFGCVAGGLLGLDPGIAGALGLVGLFCCATNAPLASIILSLEMFGSSNLYAFALVCAICFVLSGKSSLYTSQQEPFR